MELFEDESPDIRDELARVLDDPDTWLRTPNSEFQGLRPNDVIDTPEGMQRLRNIIRMIKHGMIS